MCSRSKKEKREENPISCLSRLDSVPSGTGGCGPSRLTFERDAEKVRVRSPLHHTADVADRDEQPQPPGLSPAIHFSGAKQPCLWTVGGRRRKPEEAHLSGIVREKSLRSCKCATDQQNDSDSALFCVTELGCSHRWMPGPLISITSDDVSK